MKVAGPVLEASAIALDYGLVRALKGATFSVQAGEIYGLIGPDGAGKSSLLRVLATIQAPTEGAAKVLGFDIRADKQEIRRRIGVLSQDYSLYADLSVRENLDFFAELHNVPRRSIKRRRESLLNFSGLQQFVERRVQNLSGGMRQKLALACSLIHEPRLVLMDEPTIGIDPVSRQELWSIFSALRSTGITIVLSTPYLDEAEWCSRVAFMMDGEMLIADVPPRELRARHGSFVYDVYLDNPAEAVVLLQEREETKSITVRSDHLSVMMRFGFDNLQQSLAHLESAGHRITDVRKRSPSLESSFSNLVDAPGGA